MEICMRKPDYWALKCLLPGFIPGSGTWKMLQNNACYNAFKKIDKLLTWKFINCYFPVVDSQFKIRFEIETSSYYLIVIILKGKLSIYHLENFIYYHLYIWLYKIYTKTVKSNYHQLLLIKEI